MIMEGFGGSLSPNELGEEPRMICATVLEAGVNGIRKEWRPKMVHPRQPLPVIKPREGTMSDTEITKQDILNLIGIH
jgi:hypothetical protein